MMFWTLDCMSHGRNCAVELLRESRQKLRGAINLDSFALAKLEKLLSRRTAALWLSPEGKLAVRPVFEKESFRAYVDSVDVLGLWIRLPSKRSSNERSLDSLVLLKWEYVATAQVETESDSVATRKTAESI